MFAEWGALIPGREEAAQKVLNETMQYLKRLQNGTIDSFQVVVLEPHGGDLASFVLVKGDGCPIAGERRIRAAYRSNATRAQQGRRHRRAHRR